MARISAFSILAICTLVACSDGAPDNGQPPTAAARQLDMLARETGALPDSGQIDPAGAYLRRYEGGSDRLCLVPQKDRAGRYVIGAETRFGGDEYCLGRGTARLAGSKLVLEFDGGMGGNSCTIVAEYEADRIVFPGSVDLSCAALCTSRGSFAGVSFPRAAREMAGAQGLKDRDGKALCR